MSLHGRIYSIDTTKLKSDKMNWVEGIMSGFGADLREMEEILNLARGIDRTF